MDCNGWGPSVPPDLRSPFLHFPDNKYMDRAVTSGAAGCDATSGAADGDEDVREDEASDAVSDAVRGETFPQCSPV